MKKCALFFLCALFLCGFVSPLWAGIGDNFQASSLILGGSMSFKMDKENLDVDTDDFQLFQLNPSFGLFVADGLSVFFYPSAGIRGATAHITATAPIITSRCSTASLWD